MAGTTGEGWHAYDRGRFAEARRVWSNLASAGDAQAQLGLATLYDLGQGVPVNPAIAYAWYHQAAEAGVALAQLNVAVMLDSGVAVDRDRSLAALWYARAAARGNGRAAYNLAQLYAAGEGVPRNGLQARAWYRQAAKAGLAAANRKLTIERTGPAAVASAPGDEPLAPVTLAAPSAALPIKAADGAAEIELVWLAPVQPEPVLYRIRVYSAEHDGVRQVTATEGETSAVLIRLDPVPGRYRWQVECVGRQTARRAISGWGHFTIEAPTTEPAVTRAAAEPDGR